MKVTKIHTDYQISLDENDDALRVLSAIVIASVEFAGPRGMTHLQNRPIHLTWDDAAKFITLENKDDPVLDLDYVGPLLCKTKVYSTGDGEFRLVGYNFVIDRGTPMPMFERANELLGGKPARADKRFMQRGEGLDLLLDQYDLPRKNGEEDWAYIRRVFPKLFEHDQQFCFQILMGMNPNDWHQTNRALVLMLAMGNVNIQEWIVGFPGDPIW